MSNTNTSPTNTYSNGQDDNVPDVGTESINNVKKARKGLELRKYTQQIWLAGLGAFSRAEEEGGKLFESLVKVGEDLEHKTTHLAEKTVDAVESLVDVTGRITQTANQTRGKVEHALAEIVTHATQALGSQSKKQSLELSEQLNVLSAKLDFLTQEVQMLKAAQAEKK